MSNRFHRKWHRHDHHTYGNVGEPDASRDPIAAPYDPFLGDFVLNGALSANAPLSGYAGRFYTNSDGATTLEVYGNGINSNGTYTKSYSGENGDIDIDSFGNVNVVYPRFSDGFKALHADGNVLVNNALSASSLWTNALYANSAVLLVTDMHINELSGFTVKGTDYRQTVPTTIDPATEQVVLLDGIGLSGTSWCSFHGDIQTGGNLTVYNNFTVFGNTNLNTLYVGGSSTFTGDMYANAITATDITIDNNLNVGNNVNISNNLTVENDLTVHEDVYINDTLTVTGNAYFLGDVDIDGISTFGDITVTGTSTFEGDATFNDITINGDFISNSACTFNDTATFVNPITVNGVEFDGTSDQFSPITNPAGFDGSVLQMNGSQTSYTWVPQTGGSSGGAMGGGAAGGCIAVSGYFDAVGANLVDYFDNTINDGAYWELVLVSDANDKRTSRIIGVWETSAVEYTETSSESIGDTTGISLRLNESSGDIQLIADITSGSWTIEGLRCIHNNAGLAAGGLDTYVQYNSGGILAGDKGFTYFDAASTVQIDGGLTVNANIYGETANINGQLTMGSADCNGTLEMSNQQITNVSHINMIAGADLRIGGVSIINGIGSTADVNTQGGDINTGGGDVNVGSGGDIILTNGFIDINGAGGYLQIDGTNKNTKHFYGGTTDPTATGSSSRVNYDGDFYATKVYNAVYNDIADHQELAPEAELKYGYCYYYDGTGAKVCDRRCQPSIIGIASDTFGFGVGMTDGETVPLAVAGWVLAHVDEVYAPGAVLTSNEDGVLTQMSIEEKLKFPERIVAIFKKKELEETWGPDEDNPIVVNGRSWVKVK